MDIKGKIILFPERVQKKDGSTFLRFSTSVSKKDDNLVYHKHMRVIFDNSIPEEKINKLDPSKYYLFEVTEGWLTLETYKDKDGVLRNEFAVFVKSGKPVESKEKKTPAPKGDTSEDW